MDNQQVPKADSKFQKIVRANHRKWKIRLLKGGGQKADSGGSPYKEKPDYKMGKSAPPGFGGSLEEAEQLYEVIRKKNGKYCLFSKKTNKNLGCYDSRAGAMNRERQVQYFKHLKETIIREELHKALLEENLFEQVLGVGGFLSSILSQGSQESGGNSVAAGAEAPTRSINQVDITPSADGKYPAEGNVQAVSYQGKRAVKYPSGEMRVGGTLAWRNNNPGNIRSWQGWGGIGKAYGFAVFETFEKGYQALKNYIDKYAFNNDKHTISSFMGEYCPTNQNGTWVRENPTYAQMIGNALGVPITTKTNTFKGNTRALEVFAETVKKVEGYKEGEIVKGNVSESKSKGKDDRCIRIAKRKYKAWPSAYASGAVVKCRQGKIWKGVQEEGEELEEEWSKKYKRSIDCSHPKGFSQRAHCQGRKKHEGKDPKVGTGKKPKGSDRRLYTDENPKDTVSVKFSTAEDIRDTLSKESFKSKSHARQSQIINLIHQRVRAAHENAKDPEVKARLKRALDYAEKRKEASKEKTASLQKEEEVLTEKCWPGYTQKGMKTMFGKKYPNCVKKTNKSVNKTDPGHTFKGQSHFYSNDQEEEMEEGRKLSKPSSETNLGDWFKRKGAPGKKGGWVDCNTCRDGKCKPCGRQSGEKRSKYPRCRPTPSQCKGYKRRGDNLQKEE